MRLAFTLFLVLLAFPASAVAAEVSLSLDTSGGVRYGKPQRLSGTVTESGVPLAGQPVQLQAKVFPYKTGFRTVASTVTDASGTFAFVRRFDRDAKLRVVAPAQQTTTPAVHSFTFPAVALSFEQLGPRRLRLIERLQTPRAVRLTAPVIFYLGPKHAKSAPPAGQSTPRRVKPGRFRASLVVTLPASWHGSFRYGTCFRYSPGSGMGDPKAGCPKRHVF